MKKKIVTVVVGVVTVFGLVLIAFGLASAVKPISRGPHRVTQTKQVSTGAGQKKAEEEVVDTLYPSSETAEPAVEQLTVGPSISATSGTSEWITAEYGLGDSYYHVEVADGDPEIVFSSFSEDAPDFIEIVSSDAPNAPLRTLSTSGEYELHLLFGHESDEMTLENVGLSTTFCWLTSARLRFVVEITYGNGSTVTYAEEFEVEDGVGKFYTVSSIGIVNISAPSQKQAILTSQVFSRNLFKAEGPDEVRSGETTLDNALLPNGAENLYEISIPFGFVQIPPESELLCVVEPEEN